MKVIVVLNQKGGSGKTTIATHLARAFQLSGFSVLLIDSDPQGSARDWATVREDQPLTVVGIDRPTIGRDLKNIGSKDFIIIDGLDYYHPKNPPHYYISLLAVIRSHRGGHEVSQLFTTMNAILDKNNTPCYAEFTRFSTRTLIRRWGYIDKGSPLHIAGFPALYPIWRNPNIH